MAGKQWSKVRSVGVRSTNILQWEKLLIYAKELKYAIDQVLCWYMWVEINGNWNLFRIYLILSNGRWGEGNGTPLQYSCLENPMDGGAWWAAVHGVAKSRTRLSDFTFTLHFHALEKEIATHSSVLAWRIPGMGEPGGLPSMGLHRVGHDWRDLAAAMADGIGAKKKEFKN